MFRRILVGYDGSVEAQHALHVGSALAADLRGETHVLLVIRPGAHAETDRGARACPGGRTREPLSRSQLAAWPDPAQLGRHRRRPCTRTTPLRRSQPMPKNTVSTWSSSVVTVESSRRIGRSRPFARPVRLVVRHHPCPVLVVWMRVDRHRRCRRHPRGGRRIRIWCCRCRASSGAQTDPCAWSETSSGASCAGVSTPRRVRRRSAR